MGGFIVVLAVAYIGSLFINMRVLIQGTARTKVVAPEKEKCYLEDLEVIDLEWNYY